MGEFSLQFEKQTQTQDEVRHLLGPPFGRHRLCFPAARQEGLRQPYHQRRRRRPRRIPLANLPPLRQIRTHLRRNPHRKPICPLRCSLLRTNQEPQLLHSPCRRMVLEGGDGTEKDHAVAEVHVHERYNWPKQFNNDIAIMKLKTPVDFSGPYAGPACMPAAGKDYRGHQNCMLSGWGLVKRWPQTLADRLQRVTGKIWTARDLLRQYYSLPDHVVGFGEPSKGWSACMGDSGGPLICPNGSGTYDVIGVVSFGPGSCSGKPGVFTEVSQYRDWLKAKSGGAIF